MNTPAVTPAPSRSWSPLVFVLVSVVVAALVVVGSVLWVITRPVPDPLFFEGELPGSPAERGVRHSKIIEAHGQLPSKIQEARLCQNISHFTFSYSGTVVGTISVAPSDIPKWLAGRRQIYFPGVSSNGPDNSPRFVPAFLQKWNQPGYQRPAAFEASSIFGFPGGICQTGEGELTIWLSYARDMGKYLHDTPAPRLN